MENDKLKEIVSCIIEAADEIKEHGTPDQMDYGRLLGYAEALSIIRDVCPDDVRKEIGLDFDIDKKYL